MSETEYCITCDDRTKTVEHECIRCGNLKREVPKRCCETCAHFHCKPNGCLCPYDYAESYSCNEHDNGPWLIEEDSCTKYKYGEEE